MRGGTSRGLFLKKEDVKRIVNRDEVILRMFGSGSSSQVDGVGGGFSHTSKVMIVGQSAKSGFDLEYEFGQVGVDKKFIDWTGNCGNLTSAVAPYAIDEGMVEAKNGLHLVRMLNINTMKRIDAIVPVENGHTKYEGNYTIDGVPTPGSKIETIWHDPGGSVTGKLLPTGRARDVLEVDGRKVEASLVDAGNPVVYIRAEDLGMSGVELPHEVDVKILQKIEKVRGYAAKLMGLVENPEEAIDKSPHFPFLVILSDKKDFKTVEGKYVSSKDYDLLMRLFSMQKMHHACAVTAAINMAIASKVNGSLVEEVVGKVGEEIRIGHPRGTIDVKVHLKNGEPNAVSLYRTARRIMSGQVYY